MGSLERLKALLVAKGYTQISEIDFAETFSPVIRPTTFRTMLTIALVHERAIRQLDVKNTFLHGRLVDPVFMEQPPGVKDPHKPDHVCKLARAIYGLRQAPRAWFDRFSLFSLIHGILL